MGFPSFIAPISPALITDAWGSDRSYRGEGATHKGVDFRAPIGTPVRAAASGLVLTASDLSPDPAGVTVIVDHGGVATLYMHLSQLYVTKGQTVAQGQLIALSGNTGIKESAPHLHFGVRVADKATYSSQYGTPPDGFGDKKTGGYAVPAEPFVPASYAPGVKERSLKLGIPVGAAIGVGVGLLAVVGLGLWFLWRRR